MTTNSTNQATFSILDHEDKLVETETKGRYRCPGCDGNNFTFNKVTGAYKCWSECTSEQVREALAPRNDSEQPYGGSQQPRAEVPKGKKPKPVTLPDQLDLATLPDPADPLPRQPRNDKEHGQVWEFIYIYSQTQDVTRTEWTDSTKPKGYSKVCIPYHLDAEGQVKRGKGEVPWPLYRQQEALEHGQGKWIFIPEGEPCVETLRQLGLIGLTFQGADWQPDVINERLSELKQAGIAGIVILPDNDDPGRKKANRVVIEANKIGLPQLLIEPLELWGGMPDKGDIVDWIAWGTANDMNTEKFRQRLEEVFKSVAAARKEKENESSERPESERDGHQRTGFDHAGLNKDNLISLGNPNRGTLDSFILSVLFGDGKGEHGVIDDTYYRDTNKGYWARIPDTSIQKLIAWKAREAYSLSSKGEVQHKYGTNSHTESAFKFCRKALNVGELPANEHLRAFLNCTVDMRTGEAMPHDKNHYLTTAIAADYIPNQECPEIFLDFIKSALGEEQIEMVRAWTSAVLDPTAPYGKLAYLQGPSGSGKGTLDRLWRELFGLEHSRSGDFSNLTTAEGRHQYLTGAAIYSIPDCGGYIQGLKPFYELVDNGPMSGRALFSSNGYQKQWNVRFIVASVEPLQIENSGDGWARRCLPFIFKARQGVEDPQLGTKLAEVKGQIISWALGMDREERDRLLMCPSTNEAVQRHKQDTAILGDPVRAFIDMCLRPSEGAEVIYSSQLHSWYKVFAEQHGYSNWGYTKFISHLDKVIPGYYQPRRRTTKADGKGRGYINAHWINIAPVLGVFISDESSASTSEPTWRCNKSRCTEGGIEEFSSFGLVQPTDLVQPTFDLVHPSQKVSEPTVQQCFQESGSLGSSILEGGVSKLGDFLEGVDDEEKKQEFFVSDQPTSPPAEEPSEPNPQLLMQLMVHPFLGADEPTPAVDEPSEASEPADQQTPANWDNFRWESGKRLLFEGKEWRIVEAKHYGDRGVSIKPVDPDSNHPVRFIQMSELIANARPVGLG